MPNIDNGIEMFEVVVNDGLPKQFNWIESAELLYATASMLLKTTKIELYSVHLSPEAADGERVEIERELIKDNL